MLKRVECQYAILYRVIRSISRPVCKQTRFWPVPGYVKLIYGKLRSVLLRRPTALASSLQLTYLWYAEGTRNWQHAPANAQYESCLPPPPLPHISSVVHPAPGRSFGLQT
jgi:hypothetical protein